MFVPSVIWVRQQLKNSKTNLIMMEHIGIEIHPETPSEGVDLKGRVSDIEELYRHLRSKIFLYVNK